MKVHVNIGDWVLDVLYTRNFLIMMLTVILNIMLLVFLQIYIFKSNKAEDLSAKRGISTEKEKKGSGVKPVREEPRRRVIPQSFLVPEMTQQIKFRSSIGNARLSYMKPGA